MEHKTNRGLIVLVIVLLILGGFMAYYKGLPLKDQFKEYPTDIIVDRSIHPDDQDGWIKSPTFNLYYPLGFNANEYFKTPKGEIAYEAASDSDPVFMAISATDSDFVISWGDQMNGPASSYCTIADYEKEYGKFQPGVSALACVRGMRAWAAHFSARRSLTTEDLKVFGDFVQKNQNY